MQRGSVTVFFLQMSGYPGSGKSTLARELTKHTTAVILDHDIVKSSLIESLKGDISFNDAGKASYDIEWSLVDYLSQGHSVILDSPCLYTEMIDKGLALAQKLKAKYKYIECYLNDYKEINRRLRKRNRMASLIEEAPSEQALIKTNEKAKKPATGKILVIDTSKPINTYITRVVEYVKE